MPQPQPIPERTERGGLKRMDRIDLKADSRIISRRCMVEYIPGGISGLPLNSVWGTN
jgi:hypothetical protein